MLQDFPKIKADFKSRFFLFQRSWILVSKKPRPSQVVAMVTFMDTTRIQVQNFRMLASLLLGFCWEFKVVDPKRTESQSWVPVYDFSIFCTIHKGEIVEICSKSCEVGDMACHQICWIFDHEKKQITFLFNTPHVIFVAFLLSTWA